MYLNSFTQEIFITNTYIKGEHKILKLNIITNKMMITSGKIQ